MAKIDKLTGTKIGQLYHCFTTLAVQQTIVRYAIILVNI